MVRPTQLACGHAATQPRWGPCEGLATWPHVVEVWGQEGHGSRLVGGGGWAPELADHLPVILPVFAQGHLGLCAVRQL